jgi:RHS repeat-associated protein
MHVRFLLCFSLFSALAALAFAQSDPAAGIIPFSTQIASGYESVDMASSNILVTIPIRNKPGKIPFSYGLTMNSHAYAASGGWAISTGFTAALSNSMLTFSYTTTPGQMACDGQNYNYLTLSGFNITDGTRAVHALPSTFNLTWLLPPACAKASGSASPIDGSGYTLVATANLNDGVETSTFQVFDRSGNILEPGETGIQDPDGTKITSASSNGITTYTDTLEAVALNVVPATPQYYYTDAAGNTQTFQDNASSYTQQTNFGCTNVTDIAPRQISLPGSVTIPTGDITFTYETTPGDTHDPHYVTGRLAGIAYPTGGSVSYTYSGGNNGVTCDAAFPVVPTLTKTIKDNLGNTSQWTYVNASTGSTPNDFTVTVTDPAQNQTVYSFSNDYQTQAKYYEGTATGTPLKTVVTCYDKYYPSESACASPPSTSGPGGYVSQTDVYTYLGASTSPSLVETQYDSYGYGDVTAVSSYGFGATYPPSGSPVSSTTTTYNIIPNGGSYPCGTLTITAMHDRPCSVTTVNSSGATVSQISYTYNSAGHPLTTSKYVGGGKSNLASSATYNLDGTINVATDVNGTTSTYSYGVCNTLLPTGVSVQGRNVSLSRSMTWDCNGGVQTSLTDENGNVSTTKFTNGSVADPYYRPLSVVDALSNTTAFSYTTTTFESALNFNGSISTTDTLATTDGLGRSILAQERQAPGSADFDSTQTTYGWTVTTSTVPGGAFTTQSMPYQGTAAQQAPGGTAVTKTQYDALGRPLTVTDGGGGTVSYTYTSNDVLQTTGPTQNFQKQLEYDGLGRLTSVCEITSATGSGTCGQTNSQTGFWTKYTYDALGNLTGVTQNAQATSAQQQNRSYTYDGLGRLVAETNPEWGPGTANYTYDVVCATTLASAGDLTKSIDNAGNTSCYGYDGLHRLTDAGNSGPTCRHLRYDNNATPPTGVTVTNTLSRLAEAYTDSCSGSKITDEWFGYDADGRMTDLYESTPHSGSAYYHTSACYWANGTMEKLSGIPSVPAMYYGASNCTNNGNGLDGEGRVTEVTAASGTNPVNSVTYSLTTTANALAGSLTGVSFPSGDSDSFTYYPNTGRQAGYTFSVNGKTDTGALTWNPNGTLGTFQINDQLPRSVDSQTCNYFYDALGRLGGQDANGYSVDCGAIWQQLFTFDTFGNVKKSGSSSFLATYTASTNQFTISGATIQYDGNGNLKTDNLNNTYTWDPNFGNPASVDGTNLVYDALGRMVEQQGSADAEILYSPAGKTALMNGQTLTKAFIKLPGGVTALYNSSGLAYYRHSDWLGSSRLTSTATTPTSPYSILAYAPFGEQYAISGTPDPSFTGQNSDTVSTLYDFTYRENSPSQGRWISPDPAGMAAVDPATPQSWNRYAYVVNNPLLSVDALGLWCVWEGTVDPGYNSIGTTQSGAVPGDNLVDAGLDEAGCQAAGGHWDPYNTITGIYTDNDGNVTQITYTANGQNGSYDTTGSAITLDNVDQTVFTTYNQLPSASDNNGAANNPTPNSPIKLVPQTFQKGNLVCTRKGCIQVGPPSCSDLKKQTANMTAFTVLFRGLALWPPAAPAAVPASFLTAGAGALDGLNLAYGNCTP